MPSIEKNWQQVIGLILRNTLINQAGERNSSAALPHALNGSRRAIEGDARQKGEL